MAAMTSFYAEKVLPPRECTGSFCSAHNAAASTSSYL